MALHWLQVNRKSIFAEVFEAIFDWEIAFLEYLPLLPEPFLCLLAILVPLTKPLPRLPPFSCRTVISVCLLHLGQKVRIFAGILTIFYISKSSFSDK